jgi:hypothetical protein
MQPPRADALLGSAALFGPATSGKNKGKTGQGISAANFFSATLTPTHEAHQGGGTRSPQGLATLLSGAVLFGSTAETNFQGNTGQGVSAANFYQPRDPCSKKRPL